MFLLILIILLASLIAYKYLYKPICYWKENNVIYSKNTVPLFGNVWKAAMRKVSFLDNFIELYKEFPHESFNGIYNFVQPSLLIRDLDVIKEIGVKDFDHFMDHKHQPTTAELDELFSKNLLQLHGDEWKHMRATLSPAFTGSKMKAMFVLISQCAKQLAENFENDKRDVIETDMKDLLTRFTNDVIATCAFGVQCDSIKDRENEFYMMGKDVTDFSGLRMLKFVVFSAFPIIFRLLKLEVFPKTTTSFFKNTITESIKYRTKNGVIRPDMIHLLLEARKGQLKHEENHDDVDKGFAVIEESSIGKKEIAQKDITDMDIAAQAFIFFFAGFETSATVLSFMSNELAINMDVQEKLQAEIDLVMKEYNGSPSYEAVMGMKYLDMVVSETLRKWPPAPATDRECTKEYTLKGNGRSYTVKKGENILIPIIGLHRDERYFSEPDKFDPERFSDENKGNIIPYTYLPFGVGPRACIGSRFALLEIKVLFVYLLSKCNLVVTQKTAVPLMISKKSLKMMPDNGFWVGIQARK